MKPSQSIMRAFRAIVRDRCKERQKEVTHVSGRLEQRVKDLGIKKDRLLDLLIEKTIKEDDYKEKMRRIDEEAESAKRENALATEAPAMDVDRILDFAGKMLPRSDKAWRQMNAWQRQVFQKAVFPAGIRFDGKKFGTAETSWIFKALEGTKAPKSKVASPRGFEPLSPP
jgi:hypothetical protein